MSENTNEHNNNEDKPPFEAKPIVVYNGPKFLAEWKIRFGKWLEERRKQ